MREPNAKITSGGVRAHTIYKISLKGTAILAAIESGLVKKDSSGNYPTEEFEKFWTIFEESVSKHSINNQSKKKSDHWHNNIDNRYIPVFTSVLFVFGFIFGCIFKFF